MYRSLTYAVLVLLAAGLIWSLRFLDRPATHERPQIRLADAPSSKISVVPFGLTPGNSIAIEAIINRVDPVTLMLHTAVNEVYITRTATAKMTSLTFGQSANVTSWGGATPARVSEGNLLQIGDLNWTNISITEDEQSGDQTDGKFGLNLFPDKVVRIDFEKCELTIYDSLPMLEAGYQRLDFTLENGNLMIPANVTVAGNAIAHRFLVHSGFGGTALLDDDFVRSHLVDTLLPTIRQSELKDSFGNVLKTKQVKLPELSIADVHFTGVPIGLFEGAIGRQRMSVIGGELLKRFHIILDAKQGHLYLKPNSLFSTPFQPG